MGQEIERKFLVHGEDWKNESTATRFRQGFLCTEPERTVRVRLAGSTGTLTIKGRTIGVTRAEFEYEIPAADAERLLDSLCRRPLIEKVRYRVDAGAHTWEVDVFEGDNEGLVVAEIELSSEGETFARPPWVGEEVTHDPRYFNASLVDLPYRKWQAG